MSNLHSFLDFQYKTIETISQEKQIFLVQDTVSGRIFLKRLLPASEAGYYEQIQNIDNNHLAHIEKVYHLEDICMVISEYVNGYSLQGIINNHIITLKIALRLISELCDALGALHEKNLVHRDVKPENIRITPGGSLKLIDFDIVRRFDVKKGRDTQLLGTPGFAAPEQFGFSQSDARTDIYSVGVLLNVMLTRRLPSERIYKREWHVKKIITKCVHIEKEDRYDNIFILKDEIDKVRRKIGLEREKGKGFMFRFWQRLPGLRKKNVWYEKAFAAIVYTILIAATILICDVRLYSGGIKTVIEILFNLLMVWLPAGLLFNYGNYFKKEYSYPIVIRGFSAGVAFVLLFIIKDCLL